MRGRGEMQMDQRLKGLRARMERMETINAGPITYACLCGVWGDGLKVPSTCGSELWSPSSPSPPDLVQAFDFVAFRVFRFGQVILSRFLFILSIPSREKQGNQGIEGERMSDAKSCVWGAEQKGVLL